VLCGALWKVVPGFVSMGNPFLRNLFSRRMVFSFEIC
jgi:hypothetical protein